jgi:hypothetical protein
MAYQLLLGLLLRMFRLCSCAASFWKQVLPKTRRAARVCLPAALELERPVEHSFVCGYNCTAYAIRFFGGGRAMASPKSLATMSVAALVRLRDEVTELLGKQAAALQEQLARISYLDTGRNNGRRRKTSNGRRGKPAAKARTTSRNKPSSRRGRAVRKTTVSKARAKRRAPLLLRRRATKSAKKVSHAKKINPSKRAANKPGRTKEQLNRHVVSNPKAKVATSAPQANPTQSPAAEG